MKREGAFDTAYGRLAATRLVSGAILDNSGGGDAPEAGAARSTPRSRLLPRLALMAPRRSVRLRGATD